MSASGPPRLGARPVSGLRGGSLVAGPESVLSGVICVVPPSMRISNATYASASATVDRIPVSRSVIVMCLWENNLS